MLFRFAIIKCAVFDLNKMAMFYNTSEDVNTIGYRHDILKNHISELEILSKQVMDAISIYPKCFDKFMASKYDYREQRDPLSESECQKTIRQYFNTEKLSNVVNNKLKHINTIIKYANSIGFESLDNMSCSDYKFKIEEKSGQHNLIEANKINSISLNFGSENKQKDEIITSNLYDFRDEHNKFKNKNKTIIENKKVLEKKLIDDTADESKIPVLFQCMPHSEDLDTIVRLNEKLLQTLANSDLIKNCDYTDLILDTQFDIVIRVVERQCSTRQGVLYCYGIIKHQTIVNNVICDHEDFFLELIQSNLIPNKNDTVYFNLKLQKLNAECNKIKLEIKKKKDDKPRFRHKNYIKLDFNIQTKNKFDIKIISETNILPDKISNENPIVQVVLKANHDLNTDLSFTEGTTILIKEHGIVINYFGSDIDDIHQLVEIDKPSCVIISNCKCKINMLKTIYKTEDGEIVEKYKKRYTTENIDPFCNAESHCRCNLKDNETLIYAESKIVLSKEKVQNMCIDFVNAKPLLLYGTSIDINGACKFKITKTTQQKNNLEDGLGYIAVYGLCFMLMVMIIRFLYMLL